MLYQLPDGRVIELSTEQYFDLTDEELRSLISTNYGENIDNPFFGSVLQKPGAMVLDDIEEWDELIEEIDLELPDIPLEEKLKDEYFHRDDN
mgnify:CR=1 FL=1|jgi:hypothetical protein